MAIAWMYRDDYARAGYSILPTSNEGTFAAGITSIASLALFIPATGIASTNSGSALQYAVTVLLGSGLLYYALRQVSSYSRIAARHLLKATIVYLPLQFLTLVLGNSG
jgi:heme o synthase